MSETTIHLFRSAQNAVEYSAGHPVFQAGDAGDVMYAVLEGEVELQIDGRCLEIVGPGGILGELALIDKKPRSADAVAKTDCKLVPLDEKRFTYLIQQTPFFALQVMRIMSERLRKSTQTQESDRE